MKKNILRILIFVLCVSLFGVIIKWDMTPNEITKASNKVKIKLEDAKTGLDTNGENGVTGEVDGKNKGTTKKPTKPSCKTFFSTEDQLLKRYGVHIKSSGVNAIITVTPESSDSNLQTALRAVNFYVVSINGGKTSLGPVYYDHPLTINGVFTNNDDADEEIASIIISNASTTPDPECEGNISFTLQAERAGPTVHKTLGHEELDEETKALLATRNESVINCSNPTTDFERGYCGTTNFSSTAIANKTIDKKADLVNGVFPDSKKITLQCKKDGYTTKNRKDEAGYYLNRDYFKASYEKTETVGYYNYRWAPGAETTTVPITYKVSCTETVEVKYGPPVATKAGMCFEYNVKVTSKSKCISTEPNKYDDDPPYCAPTPLCYHKNGNWTGPQAGPNDDFDDCIEKCDGGKYTEKCSKKCYQKVYGNKDKKTRKTLDLYEDVLAEKISNNSISLSTCLEIESDHLYHIVGWKFGEEEVTANNASKGKTGNYGCYYWSGDDIIWRGVNDQTPGRWYYERKGGHTRDYSPYAIRNDGFMRKIRDNVSEKKNGKYSADEICNADCHWDNEDCGKDEYLNWGVAKVDRKENKKKYKDALKKSKAAASCQTTTSTFTMKVVNGTTTVARSYPSDDSLISKDEEEININSESKLNGKHFLVDYTGCYQKNKDTDEWYVAEWGFPGTYLHSKTGQLSYNTSDSGYYKFSDKYCLPLTQTNVNPNYWKYYYTKTAGNNTTVSINDTKNNCHYKQDTYTDTPTYNILASTRDFGHFKWDFDIQCFYATYEPDCGGSEYSVRTVDLGDLFPSKSGYSTSKTTSGEVMGRDPGFNWSKYAANLKKDSNYMSLPLEYAKTVQKLGYNVYSDEYLDYEVYLTRGKIAEIKGMIEEKESTGEGRSVGLSAFSLFSTGKNAPESNSVTNYKSDLLRNTLENYVKLPTDQALRCNNMYNHTRTDCLQIEEGEISNE